MLKLACLSTAGFTDWKCSSVWDDCLFFFFHFFTSHCSPHGNGMLWLKLVSYVCGLGGNGEDRPWGPNSGLDLGQVFSDLVRPGWQDPFSWQWFRSAEPWNRLSFLTWARHPPGDHDGTPHAAKRSHPYARISWKVLLEGRPRRRPSRIYSYVIWSTQFHFHMY